MKWSFWSCPQHQRAAIWWGSVALCSIVIGGLLSRCESEPAYANVLQGLDDKGREVIQSNDKAIRLYVIVDEKRGTACYYTGYSNSSPSCVADRFRP